MRLIPPAQSGVAKGVSSSCSGSAFVGGAGFQSMLHASTRPCRTISACHCPDAVSSRELGELDGRGCLPARHPPHSEIMANPEVHRLLRDASCHISLPYTDGDRFEEEMLHRLPKQESRPACPLYVMLPLDTIWTKTVQGRTESYVKRQAELEIALHMLAKAGVTGVMIDVWWGLAEREAPLEYDFSAYKQLFRIIAAAGLQIQAVMSFHAAGGNVGDTCKVPLPHWVLEIGETNPDIFYTDQFNNRNREYLSLSVDNEPLFWGRSPVEMYRDFINAFCSEFSYLFGSESDEGIITELTIGLGPAGELRYPSYPEGDGRWRFPGVGAFQCYDKYMLADLKRAADRIGHPEWGLGGPHDAGSYNSWVGDTGFFGAGRWDSPYGQFFCSWYSGQLLQHADLMLGVASEVLNAHGRPKKLRSAAEQTADGVVMYKFKPACRLGIKVAGVHWWYNHKSHASELTAGYYNVWGHDGYRPIMKVLKKFDAVMSFTCVEMRDCEHNPEACCSPEHLLTQVISAAQECGIEISGENALQRYDQFAFDRIRESAFGRNARAGQLQKITFLRMGDLMFDNWDSFKGFLYRINSGS